MTVSSSRLLLLPLLLVLPLLVPVAGANTGTLDQAFEDTRNAGANIRHEPTYETKFAQSVTSGIEGYLECVEVLVERLNPGANDLILEIRAFDGTLPGAFVFASATVLASTIPDTASWVAFDLSATPIAMPAGLQFAIVLRCNELEVGGPQWYNWWGGSITSSTYEGGSVFGKVDEDPWFASRVDLGFRTYVTPAPVPVEAATWGAVKARFRTP